MEPHTQQQQQQQQQHQHQHQQHHHHHHHQQQKQQGVDAPPPPPLWEAVLPLVLPLAEPRSLAVCQAVCRLWRAAAADPALHKDVFLRSWRLLGCDEPPRHPRLYLTATLASFARLHVVRPGDSLAALAVRHRCDLSRLKQMNNVISDHSLASRRHVFVPVAGTDELVGQPVSFTYCTASKRDFIVLRGGVHPSSADAPPPGQPARQVPGAAGGAGASASSTVGALQAKLRQLLGRSLRVDESTAAFYLEDAGGDMKAAMEAFKADAAWGESRAGRLGPIRAAPVQRWIRGDAGM